MAGERRSQSDRRKAKAESAGYSSYYQYSKARRDEAARNAGWTDAKEYDRYRKSFMPSGGYKGGPSAQLGQKFKNPYEVAATHRNAFMGWARGETREAQLRAKRKFLVDDTGRWTARQFDERYRGLLDELGLSV